MPSRVLIPTFPDDFHAFIVAHALRIKGASPVLWYTSDYPTRSVETVRFESEGLQIEIGDHRGRYLSLDADCLWNRRPREELGPAELDPADRGFARSQCSRFRAGLLNILSAQALSMGRLCVNPWDAALRTENKLWQHHVAARVGLQMPRSIYTNDPVEIRRFLRAQGGAVIYKPFHGAMWHDGAKELGCFTNVIAEEQLIDDDLLQAVPAIYQEVVPKAYELRITMIGERAFAARLNSQETDRGQLDWRRSYNDLEMLPWRVPEALRQQCLVLMRELGIVFGCLDFIVTPDGQLIFLEVNQAGQFLFIEEHSDIPLLDAFSEFLLQGRPDFEWSESKSTLRLLPLMRETVDMFKSIRAEHVFVHEPVIREAAPLSGIGPDFGPAPTPK